MRKSLKQSVCTEYVLSIKPLNQPPLLHTAFCLVKYSMADEFDIWLSESGKSKRTLIHGLAFKKPTISATATATVVVVMVVVMLCGICVCE